MPSLTNTASCPLQPTPASIHQDQVPLCTTHSPQPPRPSPPAAKRQQATLRMSTSSSSIPDLPDLHRPSHPTLTRPGKQPWSFLHSLLLQDEQETTGPSGDRKAFVLNESKRGSRAGSTSSRKKFRPHQGGPPEQQKQQHGGSLGLASRSLPSMRRDLLDSPSGNHGSTRAAAYCDAGQRLETQELSSDAKREANERRDDGRTATPALCQDPVNQWTSSRALRDPCDEDSDEDGDGNDAENWARRSPSVRSEPRSPQAQRFPQSPLPSTQTRSFSRSTSMASNVSWRKRPLLLPPIMLPPIYTMKPTPLVWRDELHLAGTGVRAHRPISDDEWEELKGCRYLRIRPMKRPLQI